MQSDGNRTVLREWNEVGRSIEVQKSNYVHIQISTAYRLCKLKAIVTHTHENVKYRRVTAREVCKFYVPLGVDSRMLTRDAGSHSPRVQRAGLHEIPVYLPTVLFDAWWTSASTASKKRLVGGMM